MLKPDSPSLKPNSPGQNYPRVEFHLRAALGELHTLKLPLFTLERGQFNIDYNALQNLIHSLNTHDKKQDLQTSEFYGLGLLTLISHKIIRLYRNQINPDFIPGLHTFLAQQYGSTGLESILANYLSALPSDSFIKSRQSAAEYLRGETQTIPNRFLVTEELLVHLLAIDNSAFTKYDLMFKENFHEVVQDSTQLLASIRKWSGNSTGFGGADNIIDLLLEPSQSAPDSIEAQLDFIRTHWSHFLGAHFSDLLKGLDLLKEEHRFRGSGPGETHVPSYGGDLLEGEFYSEDSDWMPRVVMIARNALVWLDQLSKKYGEEIKTLADIPDQELDLLARQGFNVLWLIGLWHRSRISKKIKHWCGNPDAESSAYSLKEYSIDPSIGGPEALESLKGRAWERGIRLASDMVPNHTGLDSDWLKDHPDWYVSAPGSPFPAYRFESGDLSDDPDMTIQLEDHYYDRSDAAVVFKQQDHRKGQIRYIYHGNDGTSMPWNDTAQLDYLNPELREAIIQTILDVARQFKVIRFDAAMTLAKRHIQRLWYPEPGKGGDIPSRSAFSMSGADFHAAIPQEFWREVVDRVAREVPDTLLLAEAFWMMEGYFVRTLGMHRVYNSAFMNMLKQEENSKFFAMLAATLEFDPRILQRFVNFLSNPDEDTALAQFGKGDKYFGATILMVTLPGLPMFAHAQIEGFEEKYGMEYRRAYQNERPDEDLVTRHETQIFPLMKKRYLFAGARNFRLFPLINPEGHQVHSVFAYTNRDGTERALILVNNAYESQAGWIKTSTPVNMDPTSETPRRVSEDLIFALSFDVENSYFIIFQEQVSKLWFIRSILEVREQGLYLELAGYESQVYLNFQLVCDTQSTPWSNIYKELAGQGTSDFAPLFRSVELEPVQNLYGNFLEFILDQNNLGSKSTFFAKYAPLFEAILEVDNKMLSLEEIEQYVDRFSAAFEALLPGLKVTDEGTPEILLSLAASLLLARQVRQEIPHAGSSLIQTYELAPELDRILKMDSSLDLPGLLAVLEYSDPMKALLKEDSRGYFQALFEHREAIDYFLVHDDDGVTWFNRERMTRYLEAASCLFPEEMTPALLKKVGLAVKHSNYHLRDFIHTLHKIHPG